MKSLLLLLVRLFPAEFQRQFGKDLVAQIGQDLDRASARGRLRVFGSGLVIGVDLVRSAMAERLNPAWGSPRAASSRRRESRWRMNGLMSDLRHVLRRLWRSPRFAIAGALTLAVGVGGVVGIFALVDAVLLRPLPYPAPDRVVAVMHSASGLGLSEAGHSFGTYNHYRDNSRMLQGFAVYNESVYELSGGGEPERVRVALVTPSFFSTLGVAPALGRPFDPEDGLPGARVEVVILGHDLWTRRYGANPGIIGRMVELNRRPHEVVGVMPRGFGFPRPETEVWSARHFPAMRGAWLSQLSLSGIARLTASATLDSAERELNVLVASLAVTPSGAREVEQAGLAVHVESLREATLGDLASVLWLVFAAMVLVLAIAGEIGRAHV